MHGIGMPEHWGFSEVMGFDEELLGFIPQPVIGIVCNMNFLKKQEDLQRGDPDTQAHFYMKQHGTLDNACGIIAALHAILNNPEHIHPIETMPLSNFYTMTKGQTPEYIATFLENYKDFQEQHKGYAMQGQSNLANQQKDVKHHYVAFVVNAKQQLIELDGRKKGPHLVQEQCHDVLRDTIKEIRKRLQDGEYTEQFSMMTLNSNWN